MNERHSWLRSALLPLFAGMVLLVPVVLHAYMGTFSRYIADDFCTASTLRRLGFAASQAYWYQTWTGRYAYTFIVTLTQVAGPGLTPWLPGLALLLWMGAVLYLASRLLDRCRAWPIWLAAAAVHVFGTLEGAPSVYQSLYWQTGVITYTLPLVLSIIYGTWLYSTVRGDVGPRSLARASAVSFAAAFLLGGFSETYVTLQTTALALGLLLSVALEQGAGRKRAATLTSFGLLGSILAGLVVGLAPGTQVRSGLMPPPRDLPTLIVATLKDGYLFVARTVRGAPEAIALGLLVPFVLILIHELRRSDAQSKSAMPRRGALVALVALPALTPVLILSTLAPSEYAVSSYPEARVLITAMFVLMTGLVLWGATLGGLAAGFRLWQSPRVIRVAQVLALVVVLGGAAAALRASTTIVEPVPVARAYVESWHTRDARLRQAGADQLELVAAASLRHMGGLAEIGRDPEEWINRCVAGTYGVGAVVAK